MTEKIRERIILANQPRSNHIKMTPQEAVNRLVTERGLSQQEIVGMLAKRGVETTQPTISRIHKGRFKTLNYDLGIAIVQLAETMSPVSQESVA